MVIVLIVRFRGKRIGEVIKYFEEINLNNCIIFFKKRSWGEEKRKSKLRGLKFLCWVCRKRGCC